MALIDVVGWIGAAVVLVAYVSAARDRWPASGVASAAANLVGAALLISNALYHGALPSVALNCVWGAVGIATLVRTRWPGRARSATATRAGRAADRGRPAR